MPHTTLLQEKSVNLHISPVIQENNILGSETTFCQKRFPLIKENLEKILQIKLENHQVPNIAICCSGGSLRATLATTGFLCGAKTIGLLDSSMYLTTLSGSSWAAIPWILENNQIDEFRNNLTSRLDKFYQQKRLSNLKLHNFKKIQNNLNTFLDIKKNKLKYNQNVSIIDWYGIILSNLFLEQFDKERFNLKLSDLVPKIENGNKPFPIFSAVSQLENNKYFWMEFSPFHVGSSYLNLYVPSQSFGNKFNNGQITKPAPELSLGYLMAILGSVFSVSITDSLNKLATFKMPSELNNLLQKTETKISQYGWANKKLSPAKIANFTSEMQNSPIKDVEELIIVDGGYACNLPIQPILRAERKIDIIFILDNTINRFLPPALALQQAAKQAKQRGDKFPPIDFNKACTNLISIFKDENDSNCPIIVYMPLLKNTTYAKYFNPQMTKFCGTTNFNYSKQQAELLTGLPEYVMIQNKEIIWDLIREVVLSKSTTSKLAIQ